MYYARMGNVTVVLLGGGDKGDQSKDIQRAQRLWQELERKGSPEESLASWSQEEIQPSAVDVPESEAPKPGEKKSGNETQEL